MSPEVIERVALVTGGSRGLGALLVKKLLDEGHHVATFSRRSSEFIERTSEDPSRKGRFFLGAGRRSLQRNVARLHKAGACPIRSHRPPD